MLRDGEPTDCVVAAFLGLREGIRYFNMTTDEFYYADYLHKYGA